MASMTLQRLRQIIETAYQEGYNNCLDLKESYTESVLQEILSNNEPTNSKNDGWKVWKVKELLKAPLGTIFEHSIYGLGFIERYESGSCMRWNANNTRSFFLEDADVWLQPIRWIGTSSRINKKTPFVPTF